MSEKFKELAYNMPPRELQILWSAANAMNDNDTRPLTLCRVHLPSLSTQEAWSFLLWLRKQPVEELKTLNKTRGGSGGGSSTSAT
jgi:hypothetical protein